jgi:16S rRNA (guanine527-N7)-methyltransferase
LNINLSYYETVSKYIELLIRKNEDLNLISRKLDIKSIMTDHIYDCLSAWKYFEKYESITDLGTGAGLPGILLSIIYPDKKIELIEKSPKKTGFLEYAKNKLQLNNVKIKNSLVTDIGINSEAVTCRAFKSVYEIISMTTVFFNNNGIYLLYKATMEKINEEIQEAGKKYKFRFEINKIAEKTDKERHLVILYKN